MLRVVRFIGHLSYDVYREVFVWREDSMWDRAYWRETITCAWWKARFVSVDMS
jgi:hypothetical protein